MSAAESWDDHACYPETGQKSPRSPPETDPRRARQRQVETASSAIRMQASKHPVFAGLQLTASTGKDASS